jgi:hypothetical protein
MQVEVLKEEGLREALVGLSLSYNQSIERMDKIAHRLARKDGGHNKFLESICVWLDVSASLAFWGQFDTYRIGVTKQSESTMHTLGKRALVPSDFARFISTRELNALNRDIGFAASKGEAKYLLPQSFIQRRVVCTNYKTLRNIYQQRHQHKLVEWQEFCVDILLGLKKGEWLK